MPASAATGYEFVQVYRGRATREPQPNTAEIAAGGWWTVDDIAAWLARSPQQFTATFGLLFVRFCAPTAAVRR